MMTAIDNIALYGYLCRIATGRIVLMWMCCSASGISPGSCSLLAFLQRAKCNLLPCVTQFTPSQHLS